MAAAPLAISEALNVSRRKWIHREILLRSGSTVAYAGSTVGKCHGLDWLLFCDGTMLFRNIAAIVSIMSETMEREADWRRRNLWIGPWRESFALFRHDSEATVDRPCWLVCWIRESSQREREKSRNYIS